MKVQPDKLERIATLQSLLVVDVADLKELLEHIANRAEELYKAADAARSELG